MKQRRFTSGYSVFDVIALFAGTLGSVSAVLIALDSFIPIWVLGISVLVSVLLLSLFHQKNPVISKHRQLKLRETALFGGMSLLALVFRLGSYTNLEGGQDQGLYVNMASTLYRWGSVRFPDQFRASLDQSAQRIYDQTALSSFSLVDSVHSTMTIEFYPLHPALMAICRYIFGGYGHQSLILMSLLGVAGAWYLAIEIDGRKSVAYLFSLFVIVNPALTFFSKFPVSETIALTYMFIGMVYFLRYLRLDEVKSRRVSLLISLLSFNCLFYVRWQFILYVPFFVALILWNFLRQSGFKKQRQLFQFVGSVFVLFALSMFYYMNKQPELYTPVRDSILDMLPAVPSIQILLVSFTFLVLFLVASLRISIQRRTSFVVMVEKFASLLIPAVLLLSIPSIISLYRGVPMYPWNYRVPSDVDLWVIRYHYLYRLALFTSPWLLVITLVTVLFLPVRNRNTIGLIVFVALCLAGIQLRPFVPYLYYYGRYLIVDVLPGILLLGSIALVDLWHRRRIISMTCGVFTIIYFLFFSFVLVNKREGEQSKFFYDIAAEVSKRDVLLVSPISQQVIVPLRATFEIPTLAVPDHYMGSNMEVFVSKFRNVAKSRNGKLFYLVQSGGGPIGEKPVRTLEFDDAFFTNTDHFRGDGLAYLNSRSRLVLPFRWWHARVSWELYDLSQIESGKKL